METTILQRIIESGAAAVLAYLIFAAYRQDRKQSEERITGLATDFKATVEANTKAMTRLCVLVEHQRVFRSRRARVMAA